MKRVLTFLLISIMSFIGLSVFAGEVKGDDISSETHTNDATETVIDINSSEFVSGQYSAMEWELDFDSLYAYRNTLNDTSQYMMPRYFPKIILDDNSSHYYYKSQIVKYDPYVYEQIEFLLNQYHTQLMEKAGYYDEKANEYEENLLQIGLDEIYGLSEVFVQTKLSDYISANYSGTKLEKLYETLERAKEVGSCGVVFDKDALDENSPTYELERRDMIFNHELCKAYVELGTQVMNEGEFTEIQIGEFFNTFAEGVSKEVFNQLVEDALGKSWDSLGAELVDNTTLQIVENAGWAAIYGGLSDRCEEAAENMGPVMDVLSKPDDIAGVNLRIDYIADSAYLDCVDCTSGADLKDTVEWRSTEVIISFVSDNSSDSSYPDTIPDVFKNHMFGIDAEYNARGNVRKLTEEEFLSELTEYITLKDMVNPKGVRTEKVISRSFSRKVSEGDYTVVDEEWTLTDYANRFYSKQEPDINTSLSSSTTSITFNGQCVESCISLDIIVYNDSLGYYEHQEVTVDQDFPKTFTSINASTIMSYKIYARFTDPVTGYEVYQLIETGTYKTQATSTGGSSGGSSGGLPPKRVMF